MAKLTSAEISLYKQGSSSSIFLRPLSLDGLLLAGGVSIILGQRLSEFWHASHALCSLFLFTLAVPILVANWRLGTDKAHAFTLSLRPVLEAHYGIGLEEGCSHVGISFETKGRFGMKEIFWDIGFLTIGERLAYFGDNRIFDLSRDNIVSARVRPSFNDFGAPRLYIDYREAPQGEVKLLVIQARVGASRTRQFVELQRLRVQIAFLPDGVTGHLLGLPGKA
jgi:hypothetical protein